MIWGKCKHPFSSVEVYGPETVEPIDQDFQSVTYRLFCRACNEHLSLGYAGMIGGVDAFIGRADKRRSPSCAG